MGIAKCPKCGCGMKCVSDTETLVDYCSPPGHDHDDNCRERRYVCECGHKQTVSKRNRCPACDWVGKEECFCHSGKKVDEWPEEMPNAVIQGSCSGHAGMTGIDKDFGKWWDENEKQFMEDACHMSEFHMAGVVWEAAVQHEREECAKVCEHRDNHPQYGDYYAEKIRDRSN